MDAEDSVQGIISRGSGGGVGMGGGGPPGDRTGIKVTATPAAIVSSRSPASIAIS